MLSAAPRQRLMISLVRGGCLSNLAAPFARAFAFATNQIQQPSRPETGGGLSSSTTATSGQVRAMRVLSKRSVALGMPRRYLATTSAATTTTTSSLAPAEPLFPYGESDFVSIRKNGQFFVDKTRFLRELELEDIATFLRPPRFGKSLFAKMLAAYVDVATTDEQYDRCFGGTDIYEHGKQSLFARSFHVLSLDFSFDVSGDPIEIKSRLYNRINVRLSAFAEKYNLEFEIDPLDAMISLESAAHAVNETGGMLYTIVDEYDRFENKLIMENVKLYKEFVVGKQRQAAFSLTCSFFEQLKALSENGNRSFATGLTPLPLADASGANDLTDISHLPRFADVCGFTEADIERGLEQIATLSDEERKSALDLMRKYYNGYLFDKGGTPVYNSTQCLFFLDRLWNKPSWLTDVLNSSPEEQLAKMVDPNVNVSMNVVVDLIKRMPGGRRAVLDLAMGTPVAVRVLKTVRVSELAKAIDNKDQLKRLFSIMYYHGVVTRTDDRNLVLPNRIAREHVVDELSGAALNVEKLSDAIANPSVEDWEQIVEKSFTGLLSLEQLVSNDLTEADVQVAIGGGALVRALHREGDVGESQAESGGIVRLLDDEETMPGRSDLLVCDKRGNAVLIEIKRVASQHLKFDDREISLKKRLSPESVADLILNVVEEAFDRGELGSMPVSGKGNCKDVNAVVENACAQARSYAESAKEKFQLRQLTGFAVVSVADRLIVKECVRLGSA